VIDDLVNRVVNYYWSKFVKYIIIKYGLECALTAFILLIL